MGVGINTPHPSARLHISASDKGVLFPNVGIGSLTSPSPISTTPAVGLFIFNDGSGGVTPRGFYWWDGTKWRYLMDSVSTSGPIVGDGTPASPIGLQSGTNAGDILVWNGSQWTVGPAPFDSICNTAMTNYVQKWTGTKLCNSIIYDDGLRIGIGTSSPHPSAIMEVWDTAKGVLIPRLTISQRNNISGPAHSLLIYNIDCDKYEYFVPGMGWVSLATEHINLGSPQIVGVDSVTWTSFRAIWNSVAGALSYEIEVYENCNISKPIQGSPFTVPGSDTSFVVGGLSCGKVYCFRVSAITNCGKSKPSELVSVIPSYPACDSSNAWLYLGNAPLPGREGHVGTSCNGKVYIGLGHSGGGNRRSDWWSYDPQCGEWTREPDYPGGAIANPFIFTIGNMIYVGGGTNGTTYLSASYYFNALTQTWNSISNLPYSAVFGSSAATSDGTYGYVLGGVNNSGNRQELLRYDPNTDTWSVISNYPAGGASAPFLVYWNGYLYAGGANCSNEFYQYDIASGTWTALPNLPGNCKNCAAHVVNGKIYVAHRNWGCTPCTKDIWVYDIANNSWSVVTTYPGSANDDFFIGGVVDGKIFVGLGDAACNVTSPPNREWWMYCPK